MADLARLALNTVTVREHWTFAQCIENCRRHGIPSTTPWRQDYAVMGVHAAARRSGLRISLMSSGGWLPATNAAGRAAALDDSKRAID